MYLGISWRDHKVDVKVPLFHFSSMLRNIQKQISALNLNVWRWIKPLRGKLLELPATDPNSDTTKKKNKPTSKSIIRKMLYSGHFEEGGPLLLSLPLPYFSCSSDTCCQMWACGTQDFTSNTLKSLGWSIDWGSTHAQIGPLPPQMYINAKKYRSAQQKRRE